MLQVQSPIGSLIFHTYHEPSLVNNDSISDKIENLVDLIQFRTIQKGIDYTTKSIYNEIFDVRLHFVNFLVSQPDVLNNLSNKILDEIAQKYFLSNNHDGLGLLMSDVWEVYYKIFSELEKNAGVGLNTPFPLEGMPTWSGFKILLQQYPASMLPNTLIEFFESSFDLDYALLLCEFIFRDQLKIDKAALKELKVFLKQSITSFGAYCVLSNFWQPEKSDESQMIRNIKIRAAALRLEQGGGVSFSTEKLAQQLAN